MARELIVKVKLDSKQAAQDAKEFSEKASREFDRPRDALGRFTKSTESATLGIKTMRSALGEASLAFAAFGIAGVAALKSIGEAAVRAAINIDRQVNTLKALTGSAVEAQRRFSELIAIAQKTPGLTSNLALTLDTQLRILNTTEQTINRLLPVIGRLNAISPLGDPRRFVENLGQLITQGFEKQDLRELVGNSPFAGELIKAVFDVDSPTNAKAIRAAAAKLGIKTFEDFATAFAKAAENNPALQAVTESLGTRFEKLRDRIELAIAPIGEQIAKTLLPAFEDLVKAVETYGSSAAQVFRENKNDIIAATQQITKMIIEIGKAIGALGQLAVKLQIPEVLGRAAAEFQDIVDSNGANLFTFEKGPNLLRFERQLALIEAERKLPRLSTDQGVTSGLVETIQGIAGFNARNRRLLGGDTGGGGGGRTRRRSRTLAGGFVNDFGLAAAGDLEREAELARIRQSNEAVVRRRERERLNDPEVIANQVELARIRQSNLAVVARREAAQFEATELQRLSRRGFNRSGVLIDEAISRGQLTGGEAELLRQGASREFANQLREVLALRKQMGEVSDEALEDLREEIELFDRLGASISNSDRFMRGFNSQIDTVGDAFERFGQNVSNAFRNVRDLFNGLKSAVLGFFNDLIGQSLQNLVRNTLGGLFGRIGGAAGGGGLLGNLFRTPSFAGGDGISVPSSVTAPVFGGLFGGGGGGAGVSQRSGQFTLDPLTAKEFGLKPSFLGGIGRSLASAAPFIGAGIGSGIGGQSTFGNILGSAGGFLAGGSIAGFSGVLGAKAAAFFTNPFTAIAGVGLLVGGALLGKAKQRRADEEASGQFLTQALQGIEELAAGVSSGQIAGSQARSIFENQILGTFIQQIRTLKTKSVVESRLTNQVNDLRKVFEARIPPLISQQEAKAATASANALAFSRQIPEFATGGTTRGGLALLHPGEKVLNQQQQAAVIRQSNPQVFERAGVPGPSQNRVFDIGGTMGSGGQSAQPIEITLEAQVVISEKTATGIYVVGGRTASGRAVTVNNVKIARTNREL